MKILNIHPETPQQRLIDQVVDHLKRGGVIAYPTDTCYGLGCSINEKRAIDEIYRIKGMKQDQPLSFICNDLKHIADYANISNVAYRYMRKVLPGPYTFVLPATKLVPKLLQTKRKQVGIRVPNQPVALEIVRQLGHPIISTTCRQAQDEMPCADVFEIKDRFGHQIEMAVDGDYIWPQVSTVVSIVDEEIEILREGIGDVHVFGED